MKFLACLLVTLGVAYGAILPIKSDCRNTFCTMDLKICPDGTPAPVPVGGCCPSLSACKTGTNPVSKCLFVMCTMDLKICPDGRPAPVAPGECCPSLKACNMASISRRSLPSGSFSSILSGGNLLQSLSSATHGTNLGTAISILNLLNNVHQLSNDVHQIPTLINQTLASILNGTGQASHVVLNQLAGVVSSVNQQGAAGRDLLSALGQNANLLSSVGHILPQGTSITTVIAILNLLNNINKFSNDVHQIPAVLNETLANLLGGAGQASQVVVQQLLSLVGSQSGTSRNLLGALGENANLLSSVGHILPPGTSITTVISILKLLNNVNQLNNDIHQVPVLINQTLTSLVGGAGEASQVVVQQLLNLVQMQSHTAGRDLLGALGQNANLLSSVSHLMPPGTSISTVLSLLKLLNNVNALNNDLHQVPAVLQQTLQSLLSGVQNLAPTI